MEICAQELKSFLASADIRQLNIPASVSILDDANRNPQNPLLQGLPLSSQNLYIQFAMKENPELLFTILSHITNINKDFDEKTVIQTANIYMNLASKGNNNNTFNKLRGVILQSCGLSKVGLSFLSQLGESTTPMNVLDTRSKLAVIDEKNMQDLARNNFIVNVVDNLDRKINKVLVHKTVPFILCQDIYGELEGLSDQRKSLDETVSNFKTEFFLLDSPTQVNWLTEDMVGIITNLVIFI